MDQLLLARIDAANADLPDVLGVERRHLAADLDQLLWALAAQASHRHAVDVAAGRQEIGVEVGVRIEPQHAQLLAGLAAVARHRADRADRQAVVAAEQDRQARTRQFGVHRLVHGAVPLHHFGEMAVAVDRRQPRVGGAVQVAAVDHLEAMALERGLQQCHAQRLGAHAGAARARADVGGSAQEADLAVHVSARPAARRALKPPRGQRTK